MVRAGRPLCRPEPGWILPLAIVAVIITLAIGLVVLWLNSRGQFMFLHCVALDRAEVSVPWRKFAHPANSLFLFRLVLGAIGSVFVLPLLAGIALIAIHMIFHHAVDPAGILGAIGLSLALLAFCMVLGVIGKFTKDFVVPIQFLGGATTRKGWRTLLGLLAANLPHFILYVLFQIVLSMGIAMAIFALVLATCCIAGCLLALP